MAVLLALLWTVDATQTDTFGVSVVEDFDSIAIKDGDDKAREVGGLSRGRP